MKVLITSLALAAVCAFLYGVGLLLTVSRGAWLAFARMPTVVGATIAEQLMSGAAGERVTSSWSITAPR